MAHAHLAALDVFIIAAYLVLSFGIGIVLRKRATRNTEEYFVSGRSLPWWLIGTSMVATTFAADLEARRLEWQAVNVDEPANQHFIRDFQLYTRSVVVVDAKDPKRFKVLDRVWQLVRDKAAFQKYVEQEIRAFPRS